MSKFIDLTGQKFGRLVVIEQVGKDKGGNLKWLCLCDCGNKKIVRGNHLRSGHTQSCGCLFKEGNSTKHGHTKNGKESGIYASWQNMIQRCTNPNNKDWKDYGGRDVTICYEWLDSFQNFERDNPGWKPGLTIERKNKNGNYCPENCKWANWKEQQRNTRRNHLITAFGKTQCIAAWSDETGIPQSTIRARIRLGWSPERALTTPMKKRRKTK